MGAYKRNVVVVIKIGAYIHGMLILCKCLLSRFYGILKIFQDGMAEVYVVHIVSRGIWGHAPLGKFDAR